MEFLTVKALTYAFGIDESLLIKKIGVLLKVCLILVNNRSQEHIKKAFEHHKQRFNFFNSLIQTFYMIQMHII